VDIGPRCILPRGVSAYGVRAVATTRGDGRSVPATCICLRPERLLIRAERPDGLLRRISSRGGSTFNLVQASEDPPLHGCELARFRQVRSVGSPGGPGIGSRFVGVENRALGDGADEDAVALDAAKDSLESRQ
jgi:hypothetical protein